MGYHKAVIKKGALGRASKIQEELDELVDAEEQGNTILALCEMADLYGALKALVVRYGHTMEDLALMAHATTSAFREGGRGQAQEIKSCGCLGIPTAQNGVCVVCGGKVIPPGAPVR